MRKIKGFFTRYTVHAHMLGNIPLFNMQKNVPLFNMLKITNGFFAMMLKIFSAVPLKFPDT